MGMLATTDEPARLSLAKIPITHLGKLLPMPSKLTGLLARIVTPRATSPSLIRASLRACFDGHHAIDAELDATTPAITRSVLKDERSFAGWHDANAKTAEFTVPQECLARFRRRCSIHAALGQTAHAPYPSAYNSTSKRDCKQNVSRRKRVAGYCGEVPLGLLTS